ncbi:DNA repair and recombination helicase protein PIF1, putative [Bodo saltans]|uniref:ATP-dependent DNA helicase n=1 Tax=Bodo saltans TaxID=75058 RepID=A0A0S4ITU4_BODSA|nr:DNA repair and recombination helicase protein PIF1, putative [Bodo saltans]|eukprot:CUF92173.1 DNA repair and recombination helicase protein PIF1, putative [Bodo saltans]
MLRRTVTSASTSTLLSSSLCREAMLLPRSSHLFETSWRAATQRNASTAMHPSVLVVGMRFQSTRSNSKDRLSVPTVKVATSSSLFAEAPLGLPTAPQTIPTLKPSSSPTHVVASVANATSAPSYVYSAMNNKTFAEDSKEMGFLRSVGFGLNPARHVAVSHPDVLSQLASALRDASGIEEKVTALTKGWPRWFRSRVGPILMKHTTAIDDVPLAIQKMLDNRLKMFEMRRASRDIQNVVGDDASTTAHQAESSPSPNETPSSDGALSFALNPEQEAALLSVEKGFNTYIGGSAGTGKTVLIRAIVRKLQARGLNVAVTATTGIAGCHIGGSTFHHALGATINNEFVRREELIAHHVVIIDEVSMMSQRLFEEFDAAARTETGCTDLPFGGMQVILCGDFLQLGAINERSILHSKLFHENFIKFKLMTQVRQSEHAKFAEALSIMRKGVVPKELMEVVKKLPPGTLESNAVNLLPTNADVADANSKELERLEGDPITFSPLPQHPKINKRTSSTLVLQCLPHIPFEKDVLHRIVVEAVEKKAPWPRNAAVSIYKQHSDAYAVRIVYPDAASDEWCEAANSALLEVATTIHTSDVGARLYEVYQPTEGRHPAEIEDVLDDMLKKHAVAQECTFKVGARVLLRSNLTNGLVNGTIGTVTGFAPCRPDSLPTHLRDARVDDLIEKYRQFCEFEGMAQALLPVVRFYSGEELAVPPMEFSVGGFTSTSFYCGSRIALPLTLAYAFTVHKVQGLTLVGRVHLELSKMWPCDHLLYVAMSRVKNPDQLSVSGFDPSMVKADEMAVNFDDSLPGVHLPMIPPTSRVSMWKALEAKSTSNKSMEELLRTFGFADSDLRTFQQEQKEKNLKRQKKASALETKLSDSLDDSFDDEEDDGIIPVKPLKDSVAAKKLMKIVKLAEKMQDKRRASVAAAVSAVTGSVRSITSQPPASGLSKS